MLHERARARVVDRPGRRGALAASLAAALALSGCASLDPWFHASEDEDPATGVAARDAAIYRDAQADRIRTLERENARLRRDVEEAEDAMVAIESGLRGAQTRADVVSALAEARIAAERARAVAAWRERELGDIADKLAEAERQFQAGNPGSAMFFASRARRSADSLSEQARQLGTGPHGTLRVVPPRVNLRSGPSTSDPVLRVLTAATPVVPQRTQGEWMLVRTLDGAAGWLHASLLEAPSR
jgi:hypothetical protein